MRTETDSLGSMSIPTDALYGIHSARAQENFPDTTPFHPEWYKAIGIVKHACYLSVGELYKALEKEGLLNKLDRKISQPKLQAMLQSSLIVARGEHFNHFIVPAIQGGAGTSINMNVNEIIANLTLAKLDIPLGTYTEIDPINDANIYQSTNDVIPTALRIAAMQLLSDLEKEINTLLSKVEAKEREFKSELRIGYTQMQAAVPSTWAQLFSTYSDALGRDWWRVSKCWERIKVVNIGGGAIGTGLGTPRFFIMDVNGQLQRLTGLPLTRSENLNDTTANLDSLVEVHAILKAHAVNMEKMASDIRLLASDIGGNILKIPPRQMGSTIMPGKVNPVVCEFAVNVAHRVYANDSLIAGLSGAGCLDLNANLPLIGHALLESIKLLKGACLSFGNYLMSNLTLNQNRTKKSIYHNPSVTSALLPYISYSKAAMLAKVMIDEDIDIFEANRNLNIINEEVIKNALLPENLIKLGFSLRDNL